MYRNVASQKVEVFAFDYSTGAPKTGDAANITVYVQKDHAAPAVLTDTSATEIDSTKAPGWYQFDVSATETNADELLFTGKSTTSNVTIVGPRYVTRADVGYTAGIAEVARITGTAAGGGSNYITFTASTVTTAQCPVGGTVRISSGTGAFQWMPIASVVASGGYVTQATGPTGWTWPVTNASNASVYQIDPGPGYGISPISDVWSDSANAARTITGGNVSKMNSTTILGAGTQANPWRGG